MYEAIEKKADQVYDGNLKFDSIQPIRRPMVYYELEDRDNVCGDELSDLVEGTKIERYDDHPPRRVTALRQATAYELARLYIDLDGVSDDYDFLEEGKKFVIAAATGGTYPRIEGLVKEVVDEIKTSKEVSEIMNDNLKVLDEYGSDLSDELGKIDTEVVRWLDEPTEESEFEPPEGLSMLVFFIKQTRSFLNQDELISEDED